MDPDSYVDLTHHHQDIHAPERDRRVTPHPERHQECNPRERVRQHRLDDDRHEGEIHGRVVLAELLLRLPTVCHHAVTYHERQYRRQPHRDAVIREAELSSDAAEEIPAGRTRRDHDHDA